MPNLLRTPFVLAPISGQPVQSNPSPAATATTLSSPSASDMAYGGGTAAPSPVNSGSLYRLERGAPYKRKGRVTYATPQFKALTIYTPTTLTAQVPGVNQQGITVSYPTKTK